MWKHAHWDNRLKYGITGFWTIFILLGLVSGGSDSKNDQKVTSTQNVTITSPIEPSIVPTLQTIVTTSQSTHNGVFARVVKVVDGDTIKLDTGEVVRYIGIDTPESVDPRKPVQCYAKEASAKNKELVEGKTVELEKDISETDKYRRLLRYIWVGNTLINEYLVREGYAHASSYPPDIKYQDRFTQAQQLARQEQKGLWGVTCATNPTIAPTTGVKQQTITNTNQNQKNTGGYTCDCSKTCPSMSCDEAQFQLKSCGCTARDNDGDGVACDVQCG